MTPAPPRAGVRILLITKNSWFVGKVSANVDFAEPPNAGQIVNASRLQLGDPFDMAQVTGGLRKISGSCSCKTVTSIP